MEFLGGLVVLFVGLYAVLARDYVTGGLVGLSITYALQVCTVQCNYFLYIHNCNNFMCTYLKSYCDISYSN